MAPVDSQSLKASGEISSIDDLQPTGTYLLRVSPSLRIVPITEHISIAEVPGTVSAAAVSSLRSEERRVGKECVSTCRARWSTYHYNKKYQPQMCVLAEKKKETN